MFAEFSEESLSTISCKASMTHLFRYSQVDTDGIRAMQPLYQQSSKRPATYGISMTVTVREIISINYVV